MTLEQARTLYEELRYKYETKLAVAGLRYESDIYLEDEEFEQTLDESKAVSIALDILIFTDNRSKEDAYSCCTMADIEKGYVSETAMKQDMLEFEETLDNFIDEVLSTGDADGIIKRENEILEKESEEMMKEFLANITKQNRVVIAVCCVCAIIVVAVVIINLLL